MDPNVLWFISNLLGAVILALLVWKWSNEWKNKTVIAVAAFGVLTFILFIAMGRAGL